MLLFNTQIDSYIFHKSLELFVMSIGTIVIMSICEFNAYDTHHNKQTKL